MVACKLKTKPRPFQKAIGDSALKRGNTLIVLPTGIGKTLIAFYIMLHFNKALMLAPTKPLVKQHVESFKKHTTCNEEVGEINGEIKKADREKIYEKKQYIFATPQTVKNDIKSGALDISVFDVIVFDECHRAIGDYAYTYIAKSGNETTLYIGLTASPGGNKQKIDEIIHNLRIKNIEIRHEKDEDVSPYVQKKNIRWLITDIPPKMRKIILLLNEIGKRYKSKMESIGLYVPTKKSELVKLASKIGEIKDKRKYILFLYYGVFININHMIELIETQSIDALERYITKLKGDMRNKKTIRALFREKEMTEVQTLINELKNEGIMHPKINLLIKTLKELREKGKRGMVFAQYVDQVEYLKDILKKEGFNVMKFIGKRRGYSTKKQREVIDAFKEGNIDIIIASSIGEEGIDLPAMDFVIFYEPVPSEIRTIQRRGRAGRLKEGEVYILITKGTRDEAFFWASRAKEKKMISYLKRLRNEFLLMNESKPTHLKNIKAVNVIDSSSNEKVKEQDVRAETVGIEENKKGQKKITDFF